MAPAERPPTLLVANRGEIAVRVIRTARREGWRTVALFTDLDAAAPHVRLADAARPVPSYLDIAAVVAAGVEAGATHVHPGYGFLSERAAFARAVEEAGLTLVGPSAAVMEQMGDKARAREVAVAAGVPVVPAYAVGDEMAFPVLVKAAAGGGGKGMRIVRAPDELADAMAAAGREARSAFGDDTLLIERYVERGRHLEVQVLADTQGGAVHLFERDCSVQRRHQKVVEEAPGPTVTPDLRRRMTDAAVALARQVGYVNAGTVEFLLDNETGDFYFLEMNTRLQVEHPVTEAIAGGIDLVAEQLRIATGEPLSFAQDDLTIRGHAIEVRVYAEDSYAGFLPQAGTARLVRWADGVRVDHALESGQVVSTAYDPMLAKVVVHGADRESARRAMVAALDETAVLGLTTNVGFLRELVASSAFAEATIDTAWLDRNPPAAPDPAAARLLAGWLVAADARGRGDGPFRHDGWRSAGPPAPIVAGLDPEVLVGPDSVDGHPLRVLERDDGPNGVIDAVVTLDEERHRVVGSVGVPAVELVHRGQRWVFELPDAFGDHAAHAGDGSVAAPMPGTVLAVTVAEGEQVEEGAALGMMEAMKMELTLRAPFAGTVTHVGAAAGDQVALGVVLFEVEP
ncbi:biotin carboxylase N-terminal domain-containing protein [Nocardioides sp.]|uniref:acetyl/propionyl/methylcrotonyl-CoA carboxylase subunit alpha n=1 Tax=Nocardioides sp. TaxID=35761 RepID=UPI00352923D3